jgi:hypothetical protein
LAEILSLPTNQARIRRYRVTVVRHVTHLTAIDLEVDAGDPHDARLNAARIAVQPRQEWPTDNPHHNTTIVTVEAASVREIDAPDRGPPDQAA